MNLSTEKVELYSKMDIREIEKIIDIEHKNSPVFNAGKEQTIFDLLSTFEDVCQYIIQKLM